MSLNITLQHDETGRLLEWSLESIAPIPAGYSIVSKEHGPVQICLTCRRPLIVPAIDGLCATYRSSAMALYGGAFSAEDAEIINRIVGLAQIGADWRKDSRLEKWFPITAEELAKVKGKYAQLYTLVEAYLCAPWHQPTEVKDAYDNLVAWFVRNKRPDGTEPSPVSPEQQP